MKQGRINILSFFVVLLLFLQVKFFYLVHFYQFYSINDNQQQILMVSIVFVAILCTNLRPINDLKNNNFKLGIVLFLIYYVILLIYSSIKNRQGLVNAFIASNFYLMILCYFIFAYYLQIEGLKKFNDKVLIIATINILVGWLQFFLVSHGVSIMKVSTDTVRFGTVRVLNMSETLTCFGILIASSRFLFLKSSKRYKYLLITLLGFTGNLLVSKVRGTIIALLFGMVVLLIVKYHDKPLQNIISLLLTIACIFCFFKTPVGQNYVSSLSNSDTDTISIRQREFQYYDEQTTSSITNFLLGTGFIRDNGDAMSIYLKGPAHVYSRTDIGLFGIANAIGIIGVMWYLFLLLKCGICLYKIIKISLPIDVSATLIFSFFAFQVAYLPTMATLNPFSITSFVILMSATNFLIGKRYYAKSK